jgi:hypothetical protein
MPLTDNAPWGTPGHVANRHCPLGPQRPLRSSGRLDCKSSRHCKSKTSCHGGGRMPACRFLVQKGLVAVAGLVGGPKAFAKLGMKSSEGWHAQLRALLQVVHT